MRNSFRISISLFQKFLILGHRHNSANSQERDIAYHFHQQVHQERERGREREREKKKKKKMMMMMMSEKSICIVIFTGKMNDWRQWSKKILTVAEKKKYHAILEKDPNELEIKINEKKKMNSQAYNDLLLEMTDNVSLGLVGEISSTTYPEGDARAILGMLM